MNDARDLLAELDGLRMERAALVERIAPLGRYSSLRNDLCRRLARMTRRVLELETALPRTELAPQAADPPADRSDPLPLRGRQSSPAPYGGRQPYWVT